MFQIICLAGLAGACLAFVLIVLAYLKDRSLVLPYILFFVCIIAFGVSAFLDIKGAESTADEPSAQPSHAASSDDPSEPPSQTDSPASPDLPQSSENPSPAPADNTNSLTIGDSTSLGDWDILVTDFYYTDKIETSPYTYFHPDAGNQYAVVAARVTNKGRAANRFLPSVSTASDVRTKIYYANEYEYDSSLLLGVDKDLHDSSLNPLTSKDGIIAFSVPDVVANSDDSLSITFSAGRNEVTFSLR